MLKTSNLKRHLIVGAITGFVGAIAAGFLPWMEKTPGQPVSTAVTNTAIIGAIIFVCATILFEIIQFLITKNKHNYWKNKWFDSLMDILVANIAFLLPWLVITLGTYAGNVLRP